MRHVSCLSNTMFCSEASRQNYVPCAAPQCFCELRWLSSIVPVLLVFMLVLKAGGCRDAVRFYMHREMHFSMYACYRCDDACRAAHGRMHHLAVAAPIAPQPAALHELWGTQVLTAAAWRQACVRAMDPLSRQVAGNRCLLAEQWKQGQRPLQHSLACLGHICCQAWAALVCMRMALPMRAVDCGRAQRSGPLEHDQHLRWGHFEQAFD